MALQDATSATVDVTSTDALMIELEIPVTTAAMDHHVMTEMVATEETIVARRLGMTGTREALQEKIRPEISATR